MPELPEVENIRKQLDDRVAGLALQSLSVEDLDLLKNCSPERLKNGLTGRTLARVDRRGKYLLFVFDEWTVVNHLRMSGRWLTEEQDRTRLTLDFDAQNSIYMDDLRRLGTLHLVSRGEEENVKPLKNLGPEPLDPSFSLAQFRARLDTGREIKRLLMDQKRIAGIGNIYANEILHASRLHPEKQANRLTDPEQETLYRNIQDVLETAIRYEGTSFDDLYRDTAGDPGNFQHKLRVYGRANEECRTCDARVVKIKQGQRSSFYCPTCQPSP